MIYRREIDGLRALAVLPVILFHAGFSTFSGGFVGVDVFFVISGYLITSIIVLERESGDFSLAGFYERRARRILPALFVVMAACVPVAWLLLLPADLRDFSESLAAVALFTSNVLFWRESGYFESTAELKPLLHTWSLAVEEQYYLLFPLALLAAWKLGARWLLPFVAIAALASLALAQWGVAHHPSAAFFLLPTRGWELLLGALVALVLWKRRGILDVGPVVREAGSLAGLCMLAAAIFVYDPSTPFPGIHALLPTAGTALLILLANESTLAGKLLQQRLLVATGLISYSAYLWHQPLLAFARHACIDEPGTALLLTLCALSLALAWLTWRFVEAPFRNRARFTRRQVLVMAVAGAVLFIALGFTGRLENGHASRYPAYVTAVLDARQDGNPRRDTCHAGSNELVAPEKACMLGAPSREVGVLLGDSHADAIAHELGLALAAKGIGLRQLTYSACPPVAGLYRLEYPRCAQFNRAALDYVTRSPDVQWVVLAARWTLFLEQSRFDNREGGVEHRQEVHVDVLADGVPATSADEATRRAVVAGRYRAAVLSLLQAGKKVVLVYPIPEAGWDVPRRLARLYLRDGAISADDASTRHAVFLARNAEAHAVLDAIGEHPNLYRVRPETTFCGTPVPERCATQHGGTPLYYDDDHLSNAGARLLVPHIVRPMP